MKSALALILVGALLAPACGGGDSGGSNGGGGTGGTGGVAGAATGGVSGSGGAATGGSGGSTGGVAGQSGGAAGSDASLGGAAGSDASLGGAAGSDASLGGAAGNDAGSDATADAPVDAPADAPAPVCNLCHGSTQNAAPPKDTKGNTNPTAPGNGAHQSHLAPSSWHAPVVCSECHKVPADIVDPLTPTHMNGTDDLIWGPTAKAGTYDPTAFTCTSVYCHGGTLKPDVAGQTSDRTPTWTILDGSQKACGSACHTLPPGGTHPGSTACPTCHGEVIATFNIANPSGATWTDANKHINGKVEVAASTCTSCHGNAAQNNPAPPLGTKGETLTTQKAVGAHAQHLSTSTWHRDVLCADCHLVPSSTSHANGLLDLPWGGPATADGATPLYTAASATCSGVYCHGNTLKGPNAGGTVKKSPVWTTVDGSFKVCGASCHTNPPGAGHPVTTACPTCHGAVIASYNPANPAAATWTDAKKHINGTVDVIALTCTTCHGNAANADPSPPLGTQGENLTTQAAVGAHQAHLLQSNWHRTVQCTDCHTVPTATTHSNGVFDMSWGGPSNADGANTSFVVGTLTCTGNYCHGTTLFGAKPGGTVNRQPVWNVVNGTWDACGTTCHTNPPGGTHVQLTDCNMCHAAVVTSYNATASTAVWADATLHVNGVVNKSQYHDLVGWTSPKNGTNHHGSNWFLQNQQRDEHNTACTVCHGAALDGGGVGVSCNNPTCHAGQDWKGCAFCHGTLPSQSNPPLGVGGETTTGTLAVGRHTAHLTASATHVAFACSTCHAVPAAGNISHALEYVASASLATAGHHGDVAFSAPATGMTWNVNATQGNPVTARGTCTGKCHSNGRGGPPNVTPYWAGGNWTVGSCGNCHGATLGSLPSRHGTHSGEATCTTCHPAANASTHMNGTWDVFGTITGSQGGSVTTTGPGGPCGQNFTCNGTCHGKNHNNFCWAP